MWYLISDFLSQISDFCERVISDIWFVLGVWYLILDFFWGLISDIWSRSTPPPQVKATTTKRCAERRAGKVDEWADAVSLRLSCIYDLPAEEAI